MFLMIQDFHSSFYWHIRKKSEMLMHVDLDRKSSSILLLTKRGLFSSFVAGLKNTSFSKERNF